MMQRITGNPNIHFGKPCITNTRIPVQEILELIQQGLSFETIINECYPDIEVADIQACLQYAIEVLNAEDIHFAFAT